MADRIEREIEEILAKLEPDAPKKPVPIASRRKPAPRAVPSPAAQRSFRLEPATVLFVGAGVMLAGFVLSTFWSLLIWVAFVGVLVFLGAFLLSFFRGPSTGPRGSAPGGHYWRGQYIEYAPAHPSALDRLRRKFQKR